VFSGGSVYICVIRFAECATLGSRITTELKYTIEVASDAFPGTEEVVHPTSYWHGPLPIVPSSKLGSHPSVTCPRRAFDTVCAKPGGVPGAVTSIVAVEVHCVELSAPSVTVTCSAPLSL